MGDFDEISRALGRIENAVQTTNEQVTALFTKHDKLNEEQIEQRGAIKMLAAQHAETTKILVSEIKPAIDEFKEVKNKGIGAMFGVGLTSGGLGAGIATLLARVTGHAGP